MMPKKPFDEWAAKLKQQRGVDLFALGESLRLLCCLNGPPAILTLRRAYDEFCQRDFVYILPLDQFGYDVRGYSDAFCVTRIAGASGGGFLRLLMRTALILTLTRYEAEFPGAKAAAFHTAARRGRDLLALLPPEFQLFETVKILYGPSAFQRGYQRRRSRSSLLIIGAAVDGGGAVTRAGARVGTDTCNDRDELVPWEIFSLPLSDPVKIAEAKKKLDSQRKAAAEQRKLDAKNRPPRRRRKRAKKNRPIEVDRETEEQDIPDDFDDFDDDD